MNKYQIGIVGLSNGTHAVEWVRVKAKTIDNAMKKALKESNLEYHEVFQAIEIIKTNKKSPF